MRDWEPLCAGGEAGYTAPDPLNPSIMFGGTVTRCNVETGEIEERHAGSQSAAPGAAHLDEPARVLAGRSARALLRRSVLFKTTDGGEHWTRISDDLTRPNPVDPPNLDATTAADFEPNRGKGGVIYTIAPSPLRAPLCGSAPTTG
jgi:hypothetical protein